MKNLISNAPKKKSCVKCIYNKDCECYYNNEYQGQISDTDGCDNWKGKRNGN